MSAKQSATTSSRRGTYFGTYRQPDVEQLRRAKRTGSTVEGRAAYMVPNSPPTAPEESDTNELRSALALARAKEQINRTALRDSQNECKKLRDALKLAQERLDKSQKDLAAVSKARVRGTGSAAERRDDSSRPADTPLLERIKQESSKRPTVSASTQTTATDDGRDAKKAREKPRAPPPPFQVTAKKRRASHQEKVTGKLGVSKLSEKLQHEKSALEARVRELEQSLTLLADSARLFEEAVMAPLPGSSAAPPTSPTVREIVMVAQHTSEDSIFNPTSLATVDHAERLTTASDIENIVLSFSDLATEVRRLRAYKQRVEAEQVKLEEEKARGEEYTVSGQASPLQEDRFNVLSSKLRIVQLASEQKEKNLIDEIQRLTSMNEKLNLRNIELSKEMVDIHWLQREVEKEENISIETLALESYVNDGQPIIDMLQALTQECTMALELTVPPCDAVNKKAKKQRKASATDRRASRSPNSTPRHTQTTSLSDEERLYGRHTAGLAKGPTTPLTIPEDVAFPEEGLGNISIRKTAPEEKSETGEVEDDGCGETSVLATPNAPKVFMLPAEMNALHEAFR